MKICLVNSFYPPWMGGVERYVSSLAREFTKSGHEVTVYCSSRPVSAGVHFEEGVKIHRLRTPLVFYGTPIVLFPPDFLNEKYDIIHANFPGPYIAAASATVSALRGIPSVLTWHNDLPAVTRAASHIVRIHNALSPLYLERFEKIIATTRLYAGYSNELTRHADKVVIIPSGVDTVRFNPNIDPDSVRAELGLTGKKVVLFVGALTRWHDYKGVDVLLNAFQMAKKDLDDLRLLIVGVGPMSTSYKRLARELNISDSVIFAGYLSDSELASYYAACDFLVLPSKNSSEGYGLVILEAMASGKPVIASRAGGIPEVVQDGEDGLLVPPRNPVSLARKMVLLATDDSYRLKLGSRARKTAEKHDWSTVALQTEQVYATC